MSFDKISIPPVHAPVRITYIMNMLLHVRFAIKDLTRFLPTSTFAARL